jgi:hypothetical protein
MSPFGSVFASLLTRSTPDEPRAKDQDRVNAYWSARRHRG